MCGFPRCLGRWPVPCLLLSFPVPGNRGQGFDQAQARPPPRGPFLHCPHGGPPGSAERATTGVSPGAQDHVLVGSRRAVQKGGKSYFSHKVGGQRHSAETC